jgi:HK97 family phage major capsid protein
MFKTVKALREEINSLSDSVQAIVKLAEVENRNLSNDETAEVDRIQGIGDKEGEIQALQKQLERAEKTQAIKAQLAGQRGEKLIEDKQEEASGVKAIKVPARARRMGALQAFKTEEEAYGAGKYYQSLFASDDDVKASAKQWCREHGMVQNAMTTGDNTKGGFLVPEPLEATIIELREKFGVFRQNAMQIAMDQAVMLIPKLNGEVTTYYVGEGDPVNTRNNITASDMALQQVKLEAKKLASLTPVSNELSEDAIISVADMLTRSIAYKMAFSEDDAGFNGDGTSTYGSIVGIGAALGSASKVTATSRTTFSALTMADFETVIGTRKMWGGSAAPKWYISQVGWANSMQRLMDAYSGNTVVTIANGAPRTYFLGYEVVISQVLNKLLTGTTGQTACYFGDLSLGVYMGTRRGLSVDTDKSLYFNYDATVVRATQRYDIKIHDTGDSTTAGGLVSLIFG